MTRPIRGFALAALCLSNVLACGRASALEFENLEQYKAEYAQLAAGFEVCRLQMQQFNLQQALAAANGYLLPQPACFGRMQANLQRYAFLEMRIYRLATGDNRTASSTLVPNFSAPSAGVAGGASQPANQGGGFAMQAIRGNSLYTDESGAQHELPTRNFYFRDRASGTIVGSDSADLPDVNHDYERFR